MMVNALDQSAIQRYDCLGNNVDIIIMTLYAILSDIHANYPALMAAVRDARSIARREDDGHIEFISLGDVVDYGPQPNECVAWVRRYATVTVQGNHDRVAAAPLTSPAIEIESSLWPILLWTRLELSERNKQTLLHWRLTHGRSPLLSAFTPFHSNIDESDAYINNTRVASRTLQRLMTPYGLFGHTHLQGYYIQSSESIWGVFVWPGDLLPAAMHPMAGLVQANEWFLLPERGEQVILNPGSIGQPRQHRRLGGELVPPDYRAAYLLLRQRPDDGWEARFQRVSYPIEETILRMRERVQWEKFQMKLDILGSRHKDVVAPTNHPFSSQLFETIASMETLLPALRDRLIEQLISSE